MISPISQTAAVPVTVDAANTSSESIAQESSSSVVESEAPEQLSSRTDNAAVQAPEVDKAGKESAVKTTMPGNEGEVRKSEVKDGEMRTKVYDRKGKLLRVIPPGYIPVGEKRFDITV